MWRRLALLAVVGSIVSAVGCSGGGDDDDDDDDDDDGGSLVTVTGEAHDDQEPPVPISGATVAHVGGTQTDTTAADGIYTLQLASNASAFLRRTATGFYPIIVGLDVPPGGTTRDIGGPDDTQVADVETALGVTITEGIVAVNFQGVGTTGGFMASISATEEGSFVFDAGNSPVDGDTTIDGSDNGAVIFYNVPAGTTTISVTEPGTWTCTPEESITNWVVEDATITQLEYECTE